MKALWSPDCAPPCPPCHFSHFLFYTLHAQRNRTALRVLVPGNHLRQFISSSTLLVRLWHDEKVPDKACAVDGSKKLKGTLQKPAMDMLRASPPSVVYPGLLRHFHWTLCGKAPQECVVITCVHRQGMLGLPPPPPPAAPESELFVIAF